MRATLRLLTLVLMLTPASTFAQPVPSREPASTHIFPAGGRRGSTVPVRVGAECIPPGTGFRIWGQGVSAPALLGARVQARLEPSPRRTPLELPISYPKEWESTIDIAADAPLGRAMWRLSCARGGTGTRPFLIGELPEFVESEPNSTPEHAERVTLPVTVNGRIAGENDLDYFLFALTAGDTLHGDVIAGRIGSSLDPVVEFRHADGRRLDADELRVGTDPFLTFRAPETGDYTMLVSNVGFHGGPAYVYRITLTTAPYDPFAASARPDPPQPSDAEAGRAQAERPASAPRAGTADAPAAAVATSERAASAAELALPAQRTGRFLNAAAEDWFRIRAQKDQMLSISCRPYPAGVPTLPIIEVRDVGGGVLARASSAEVPDRECAIDWRAPADGEFLIRLCDLRHGARGGPEFRYLLTVREAAPAFTLGLASDFINVPQGGKAELPVTVRRTGGCVAPVEIEVEGLPPGVRVEPAQLAANQDSVKLSFVAEQDAQPSDATLRVIGKAPGSAQPLEETARAPHLGRDAEGVSIGPPTIDRLHLTVQHKPMFRLFCSEAYQYAHRGTIYPYRMEIERLNGFDGEVTIQLGDRQNRDLDGIEFLEITVPPGQTTADVPIYFPETMHINAFGQCQLYAQGYAIFRDKAGESQSTLVVSEKRNIIRTLPTMAKLSALDKEVVARPGATIVCTLELERTPQFTGAMRLALVEPAGDAGFASEPVEVGADQDRVEIPVHVSGAAVCPPNGVLRFRVRGDMTGGVTVIAETSVPVRFEQP